MPLISSKMTFYYKRIFPIGWFGFTAAFFLVALLKGPRSGPDFESAVSVIFPVLMVIIGYLAAQQHDDAVDAGRSRFTPA